MSVDPQRVDRDRVVDYSSDVLSIMTGMPGWPDGSRAGEAGPPRELRALCLDPERGLRLDADRVEELRRRLREAAAREEVEAGSGVRAMPSADDGTPLELEVAIAPRSDSNFYAGFDDARPHGVFVATYRRIPVGTPVTVTVWLPGEHAFRAEAIVEWVREAEVEGPGLPAGVGLSLGGLDEETRRQIAELARVRPPIFYVG